MDEETARQLSVFVQLLAARSMVWSKRGTKPWLLLDQDREWKDYHDVLGEIALGRTTRRTHCRETILIQGRLLDFCLAGRKDFMKCHNVVTKKEWIVKNAPDFYEILNGVPCFCTYAGKLVESNGAIDQFTFIEPHWLKSFLSRKWTPGRLRDAWLAMLHGTTLGQIAQVRKGPSSFDARSVPFRFLDQVISLPRSGSEGSPPTK